MRVVDHRRPGRLIDVQPQRGGARRQSEGPGGPRPGRFGPGTRSGRRACEPGTRWRCRPIRPLAARRPAPAPRRPAGARSSRPATNADGPPAKSADDGDDPGGAQGDDSGSGEPEQQPRVERRAKRTDARWDREMLVVMDLLSLVDRDGWRSDGGARHAPPPQTRHRAPAASRAAASWGRRGAPGLRGGGPPVRAVTGLAGPWVTVSAWSVAPGMGAAGRGGDAAGPHPTRRRGCGCRCPSRQTGRRWPAGRTGRPSVPSARRRSPRRRRWRPWRGVGGRGPR